MLQCCAVCVQVFHCVHFECPADMTMNNLMHSGGGGINGGSANCVSVTGPPNSPHLNLRPGGGNGCHASGLQMPSVENEQDYYRQLPQGVGRMSASSLGGASQRSGSPGSGAEGGGGASGGSVNHHHPYLPNPHPNHHHHHHRHSSVSSNASSNGGGGGGAMLGLPPSPRVLAMDMYARPESQQDQPEADRMDTH
jgi:hypothetical protein